MAAQDCARSLEGRRTLNLEVSPSLKHSRSSPTLCTPYREDKLRELPCHEVPRRVALFSQSRRAPLVPLLYHWYELLVFNFIICLMYSRIHGLKRN